MSLYAEPVTELDILERIGPHRNIAKVLHTYEGSIERFRQFIHEITTTPPVTDRDLSSHATFIVTEQMPTIANFIESSVELKSTGTTSVFLTHALYQLLKLTCLLDELNISHNNINKDNVFINSELNPVLGNFECATCQDEKLSTRFSIRNDEDRDYINVTHISRGSQVSSSVRSRRSMLLLLSLLYKRICIFKSSPCIYCSSFMYMYFLLCDGLSEL